MNGHQARWLKQGEVVRLKSGGPKMVVMYVKTNPGGAQYVGCIWSDGEGGTREREFPIVCLDKASVLD